MTTAPAETDPEALRKPNRQLVIGEYPPDPEDLRNMGVIEGIHTGDLNIFMQQRGGRNAEQDALKESLKTRQINPINVAIVDLDIAQQYLEFTNKTWGDTKGPESLKPLRARYEDDPYVGMYAILAAGHSRVQAKRDLAEEYGRNPDDAVLSVQFHRVKSVEDILEIQIAENIHSQPKSERSFRAVAEMYLFMQAKDPEHMISKREFGRRFRVSEHFLDYSLSYAAMPEEVRRYTDDGILPLYVLIELAKARQPIVDTHRYTVEQDSSYAIPADADEATRAEIEIIRNDAVNQLAAGTLNMLISRYTKATKKSKDVAQAIIGGHAESMRRRNAPQKVGKVVVEMGTLFGFGETMTVENQLEADRAEMKRNLREYFSGRAYRNHELVRRLAGVAGLDDDRLVGKLRADLQETLSDK